MNVRDTLALRNANVIDGTGRPVSTDTTVLVEGGVIQEVGSSERVGVPHSAEVVDLAGAWVIPGLMDANVHLVAARTADTLLEFERRYHELAAEAAELTLWAGVTTVFDTWGPIGPLSEARDAIATGARVGSRIYCSGNIVGLGGPMSADFADVGAVLDADTVRRIDEQWERGTGPRLCSMSVGEIGERVASYIDETEPNFVKYAASDHLSGARYLLFSESAQRRIVEVVHERGLRAQAHTTTVESLRMEIEAGADLLQHGDATIDQAIPDNLLDVIVDRELPVAALLVTERHLEWNEAHARGLMAHLRHWTDVNDRALIGRGARLLLTTDGFAYGKRIKNHPGFRSGMLSDDVPDMPTQLGRSHLHWLAAAHERGMPAMEVLRSATSYIADAYGVGDRLGTVEVGKVADLVVLDADPLEDPSAYGKVRHVLKDGRFVDREALGRDLLLADDPR